MVEIKFLPTPGLYLHKNYMACGGEQIDAPMLIGSIFKIYFTKPLTAFHSKFLNLIYNEYDLSKPTILYFIVHFEIGYNYY